MDGLWATKSEGVVLIVCSVSFQDFKPMRSQSTNVTDRQTDRQTDSETDDMRSQDCAGHYSASRGKNNKTTEEQDERKLHVGRTFAVEAVARCTRSACARVTAGSVVTISQLTAAATITRLLALVHICHVFTKHAQNHTNPIIIQYNTIQSRLV